MKAFLDYCLIDGDIYHVNMLPITPDYDEHHHCPSLLVVERLVGGNYWIMQIDNIHDVVQQHQYNITATSNEGHANFLSVPLLPKP